MSPLLPKPQQPAPELAQAQAQAQPEPEPDQERAELAKADQELGALADAAKGAADRAGSAIDDAMAFIAASNKRIASMESAAAKHAKAAPEQQPAPELAHSRQQYP